MVNEIIKKELQKIVEMENFLEILEEGCFYLCIERKNNQCCYYDHLSDNVEEIIDFLEYCFDLNDSDLFYENALKEAAKIITKRTKKHVKSYIFESFMINQIIQKCNLYRYIIEEEINTLSQ